MTIILKDGEPTERSATFSEWIERAMKEPTLAKARVLVALFECERVIYQSKVGYVGPGGEQWDTCFEYLLKSVEETWKKAQAQRAMFSLGDVVTLNRNPATQYFAEADVIQYTITGTPLTVRIGEDEEPGYSFMKNVADPECTVHHLTQTLMEDGHFKRVWPTPLPL